MIKYHIIYEKLYTGLGNVYHGVATGDAATPIMAMMLRIIPTMKAGLTNLPYKGTKIHAIITSTAYAIIEDPVMDPVIMFTPVAVRPQNAAASKQAIAHVWLTVYVVAKFFTTDFGETLCDCK